MATPYPSAAKRLPNEVIQSIIDLTDQHTLPSIRLSNRKFCANAASTFGRAFFSERRHILSNHSLEALVDITAHPDFAPFVRTVKLGSTLCARDIFAVQSDQDAYYAEGHLQEHVRLYYARKHEQRTLCAGSDAHLMHLLGKSFENLQQYCHSFSLGVWQNVVFENGALAVSGYGGSHFHTSTILPFIEPYNCPAWILQLLIRSATQQGCQVYALDISAQSFEDHIRDCDGVHLVLSNLKSMKLDLSLSLAVRSRAALTQFSNVLRTMRWLFEPATNVDIFCISFDAPRMPKDIDARISSTDRANRLTLFTSLLQSVSAHQLKELSIQDIAITSIVLQSVLVHSRSSIKVLDIARLIPVGDWQLGYQWLLDETQLESARLPLAAGFPQRELRGREIKEALEMALEANLDVV